MQLPASKKLSAPLPSKACRQKSTSMSLRHASIPPKAESCQGVEDRQTGQLLVTKDPPAFDGVIKKQKTTHTVSSSTIHACFNHKPHSHNVCSDLRVTAQARHRIQHCHHRIQDARHLRRQAAIHTMTVAYIWRLVHAFSW
jgi:hypothetical protein